MFIVAKASLIETVEFEARNSKHLAVLHHVDFFQKNTVFILKKPTIFSKKNTEFFSEKSPSGLGTDKKTIAFFSQKTTSQKVKKDYHELKKNNPRVLKKTGMTGGEDEHFALWELIQMGFFTPIFLRETFF